MLMIDCPHCGPRAEIEFRYAGEAHMVRPGADRDDATWAAVRAHRDERAAIELLLLVGHYDMLATTLLTLRVEPDERLGR